MLLVFTVYVSQLHRCHTFNHDRRRKSLKNQSFWFLTGSQKEAYGVQALIEFSHLKPVNDFAEFDEFLLDTDGAIAICGQGFMYHPWKRTISGTSLFTIVVRITYVRLDNLTT